MKPRIKKVNGEWRVLPYEFTFEEASDNQWIAHVIAYNFCIMLNNRK
jgi:hypothetical protein